MIEWKSTTSYEVGDVVIINSKSHVIKSVCTPVSTNKYLLRTLISKFYSFIKSTIHTLRKANDINKEYQEQMRNLNTVMNKRHTTLHPIRKLKDSEDMDVCIKCRYKQDCGAFEGVYKRCLNEVGSREYYAED